jgi:hypothetical protein
MAGSRRGSWSGGRLSALNALRGAIVLLAVAGIAVVVLHFVSPARSSRRASSRPPATAAPVAAAPRLGTSAQVYAAVAQRLLVLRGRNVRQVTRDTWTVRTAAVSATDAETTTLDLDGTRCGRSVTVDVQRRLPAGGTAHYRRVVSEYLTFDGGVTTYARTLPNGWQRIGGKHDAWIFDSPQRGLLYGMPKRAYRLAGHAWLAGSYCVLLRATLPAVYAEFLVGEVTVVGPAPPRTVARSSRGQVTLWVATSDATVMRSVIRVRAQGSPGRWRFDSVQDLSRWGLPVTPAIVRPVGA